MREDIREHIAELLRSWCIDYEHDGRDDYLLYVDSILEYLKSQGCVILYQGPIDAVYEELI